MSVPSDQLMNMIRQDAGKTPPVAPPEMPKPALSGAETPPMAAPMLTPEDAKGDQAGAKVNIQIAMDLMQQALPAFGSESVEGKKILDVLTSLARVFGETEGKTRELIPAEILQMVQSLPQTGGASAAMKSMLQAPIPGTQEPPLAI